jgi:hypothetical protein
MFEGPSATAHFVEDERGQLAGKLTGLLRPDVSFSPAAPEIGFIHRKIGSSEVYFVANTSNARRNVNALFRVQGMRAEWWDPMNGAVAPAEAQSQAGAGIKVALELEPYGSKVLVFSKRTLAVRRSATPPAPIELSSGWRVSFGESRESRQMARLQSWTEAAETRFFSGLATYEKTVVVPDVGVEMRLDFGEGKPLVEQPLRNGMRAWLDAPVREAAVVYVNDRKAGSVWCPPFAVDVTDLVKKGENRIRVVVGNTAINYMAGRRLPDYRLLNLRYGVRFEPQDMENLQPVPSGMLGSVRLIAR